MHKAPCVSADLHKGNNFHCFLFACLDDVDLRKWGLSLTLLHSERPKLYTILAFFECNRVKERICLAVQLLPFNSSNFFLLQGEFIGKVGKTKVAE